MARTKTYSELVKHRTYEDRLLYLQLRQGVGAETFGAERFLNQAFYNSKKWKMVRDMVIARDQGCDIGMRGYDILGTIYVHHINTITAEDIENQNPCLYDMENLITLSHNTHNAVHYGSNIDGQKIIERQPNDDCPWIK